MHHKRKRSTTRREVTRMDNKSYRAAESRVIHNADRAPANPRTDRYSYRPEPLPLFDLPCNGTRHGKPKEPKKKKTPAHNPCPNGQHEWYEETVEGKDFILVCPHDIERGYKQYYYRRCGCRHDFLTNDFTRRWYKTFREQKTCIHCWKVRVMRTWDENPFSWENRYGVGQRSRWGGPLKRKIRTQDPVSGMTLKVR